MLAKVKCHSNLNVSIGYSEVKMVQGKAECLLAVNFTRQAGGLSHDDKVARFAQRTSLHEGVTCNAVHISLNFSPREQLSNEKMKMLAQHYMQAIGFDRQPYLVYRHSDAHHPHMHVVSTNITADGKRIQLQDIVRKQSREVVHKMEERFSLAKNERSMQSETFQVQHAQRVIQGEMGIKRAISDVLNTVMPHFNYTNMGEYNAALRLYNVAAHQGKEGSRLQQTGGLLYYALNKEGQRISLPMKASSFLLKPTLATLEKQFVLNLEKRKEMLLHVNTYADWILNTRKPTWEGFKKEMLKEGISVVVQADKTSGQGSVYFVHHQQKAVLSGESMGPAYALQTLQQKCSLGERQELGIRHHHSLRL
jgi:hypothetical protein